MTPETVGGLAGSGAWAWAARCLLHGVLVPGLEVAPPKGRLVVVRGSQDDLEDLADAFGALEPVFLGCASATAGSAPAAVPKLSAAVFGDDPFERLSSLRRLEAGARLVLASGPALPAPLPSPAEFAGAAVSFGVGEKFRRGQAVERLEAAGYRRVEFVESPGEYAVRGAVLDFFGVEPAAAVRALYDEDTVASLRTFDPATQVTKDFLPRASATLAREGAGASLGDWVGEDSLWIVEEGVEAALPPGARACRGSGVPGPGFGARPLGPFGGDPARAWAEMGVLAAKGFKVLLFSLNRGEDARVQEILTDKLPEGACQFLVGALRQGFLHESSRLAVFSTAEIFERRYRAPSRWNYLSLSPKAPFRLAQLKKGDFVVHRDYGVALYRGLESVAAPGHAAADCLRLEYRGGDTVFVAMTEFDRVQKYSGGEGKRPRLSSLNTRRWAEVKAMVAEGVRELAGKLIRLEAERRSRPGFAFEASAAMEREFAEEFPFEETPDQSAAIADVLRDMESPHPMDRLVVGDVGFGKTEVAMRAAFRCAAGFKQAAVLVPTTILADQHFRTFTQRFADYPVKLGLLTRFQGAADRKAVLAGLAKGSVDVVIGTARLLQRDVRFKDLGLVVIDEEHRFGVRDKERLKALRSSVDCLALSATPIPRTLHQAMSGLRGISLIQSAPAGRLPIETRIAPWSPERVAAAVSEELARGGQVYYVHNRVRSLPACVEKLSDLCPSARFGMAHGRLSAAALEEVMWKFFNREFDVLVASSIIESGLDIPSVNTLLMEDAQEFGLAQIYQLRGRIGRERQKAFCWLFLPEGISRFSELEEDARKRLEAVVEFGQVGSGLRLAMRDLEIRGAGDLLGGKQHGFIDSVGVEFYTQLLQDEIARLRAPAGGGSGEAAAGPEVAMDFQLDACIPRDYLPGDLERLEFYKRILRSGPEDWPGLRRELSDLSGPLPGPVERLFDLLRVRRLAQAAGVGSILQRGNRIEVAMRAGASIDPGMVGRWLSEYGDDILFFSGAEGDGLRVELGDEPPLAWVRRFLESLAEK